MNPIHRTQIPATLRLGSSIVKPAHMAGLLAGILLVPLAMIIPLLYGIRSEMDGDGNGPGLLGAFWAEFSQDPENRWMLWALAVSIPLAIAFTLAQRLAWIRVTSTGLVGHIPRWLGLGLTGQTAGDWQIQWDEVTDVRLEGPDERRTKKATVRNPVQRMNWYRLVIETRRGAVRLNPMPWFDPAGRDHRLGLGEMLTARKLNVDERVRQAPLVRLLEDRYGISATRAGEQSGPAGALADGFDLAGHKGMLVQLGLLGLAACYGVADAFFIADFKPLESMPILPYGLVAAVAIVAVAALGRGAPKTERLVVGALTVAALVAAVHPALLRFNALTAQPRVVEYRAVAPGQFEPVEGHAPVIDLGNLDLSEYWSQYPPGARHEFTLLRGDADFHQLDLGPLFARTRAFYRQRDD